jgi:hypothetical protein
MDAVLVESHGFVGEGLAGAVEGVGALRLRRRLRFAKLPGPLRMTTLIGCLDWALRMTFG